jgi:hypothetical protein
LAALNSAGMTRWLSLCTITLSSVMLLFLRVNRNGCLEHRSMQIGFDLQKSAKVFQPFSYARQTDANIPVFQKRSRTSRGSPMP